MGSVRALTGAAVRGCIIAPPGKKLVIADLANIEGRVAAWLAGEEWKMQAFRDFDTGKGPDLYKLAYAKSFNVDASTVNKEQRQIGKVEELMFQYQGGVGAWITGAATYGIDLEAMTEAVWDVLPEGVKDEAASFLNWLYSDIAHRAADQLMKVTLRRQQGPDAPDFVQLPTQETWIRELNDEEIAIAVRMKAAQLKARMGLTEKTFIACDAIKRLWREAHPEISRYWKLLENVTVQAIETPGVTFDCKRLKVRRDGSWLRIGLPSKRALCYLSPEVKDGKISFVGLNSYTHQWGRTGTYGGKLFENVTQAVACDQLANCLPVIEAEKYEVVITVHDEVVCEVPDTDEYTHIDLSRLLCTRFEWNRGLPLAAAGFTTKRYYKG